jgi:predicted RNA binding protein YcfA (HicA-like mRNA interferase family)
VSGSRPPLTCAQFEAILRALGFAPAPKKQQPDGSHENWIATIDGKYRKVTVDCPKAPFSPDLIHSMAKQAGITVKRVYEIHFGLAPQPEAAAEPATTADRPLPSAEPLFPESAAAFLSTRLSCAGCPWHGLGSETRTGNMVGYTRAAHCPQCGRFLAQVPLPE